MIFRFPLAPVIGVLLAVAGLCACSIRPEPLAAPQGVQFAAEIKSALASDTEALVRPLDLYEAIARALVYNQELKAEQMARALGEAELRLQSAEMLPQFVAGAQIYSRDKQAASYSRSAASGAAGGYSTSSERTARSGELSFSWNILDLGVSYFRARQAADRSLIAAEQYRRIANRIVEETRIAYWRAVALQRLDEGLARVEADMAGALNNAARLGAAGLTEPGEALGAQRDLLSIRRDLDIQRRSLVGADDNLRALINHPANQPLRLAAGPRPNLPAINRMSFEDLADQVLTHRPEVRQSAYEMRITAEEARIAFIELFPSINLALGATLDQNPFLLHQGWTSAASRASWQVMKILQYPMRSATIDTKSELDRLRARSVAVAVILQGQLSLSRFAQIRQEYATLQQLADVQRRLALHAENQRAVGRAGSTVVTRERMNALLSDARREAAYGELQAAYGNVLTSLGHDSADPAMTPGLSAAEIASRLRTIETAAFDRAQGAAPRHASARVVRQGPAQ